jgi:hypothetical protein
LITVFVNRRLPSSFSPSNIKKASDSSHQLSCKPEGFIKFNIQEWTDVALTGNFCSALLYILTQDTRLATVFAANF